MKIYPRNANDALIRAGMDSKAVVHLHIDEVKHEALVSGTVAQAVVLEGIYETCLEQGNVIIPIVMLAEMAKGLRKKAEEYDRVQT